MTSLFSRGRWQRVVEARKQARAVLGAGPPGGDRYGPPKAKTPMRAREPKPIAYGPGVGVLSLGEAAARLAVSRAELEAMIVAGKVKALPTGYTRMIPTSEVDRLTTRRRMQD